MAIVAVWPRLWRPVMHVTSNDPERPAPLWQDPSKKPEDATAQTREKPESEKPKDPVIRDWASI